MSLSSVEKHLYLSIWRIIRFQDAKCKRFLLKYIDNHQSTAYNYYNGRQ